MPDGATIETVTLEQALEMFKLPRTVGKTAEGEEIKANIGKSHGADVTGGMESKVKQMLELVEGNPDLTIEIFSGVEPGNIVRALTGETLGTVIKM
jgi:isopentenyl phosphate kinase